MKKYICLLLLIHLFPISGKDKTNILHERIYMQTDKQLYLSGELLQLKIITVDINRIPLSFSKIAYVELLDSLTSHVQAKIELSNGMGNGWMELPPTIPTGYYRLVAYTRYMRNENPEVFFEKSIGIVNLFQSTVTEDEKITRNMFSENDENLTNTIFLSTDNLEYNTRNRGYLIMDSLPENIQTLSVSINGKDFIPIPGINNIRDWGEQSLKTTQNEFSYTFLPEYEGHIITGKITDGRNETSITPDSLISFISFPGNKMRLFKGQLDSKANVSFYTTYNTGVHEIATTVHDFTGKKHEMNIQSPFIQQHVQKQLPVLQFDSTHVDQLLERNVALQILYSFTRDSLKIQNIPNSYFEERPDNTYILDNYTRFTTMKEVFTEFVWSARFRKRNNHQQLEIILDKNIPKGFGSAFVLLDGIPIMNHDIIYNYNPLLVQKINLYSGRYVFGGYVSDGIIEFSTYRHDYPNLPSDAAVQIINYDGTQAPRRFYIPDYSDEKIRQSRVADYRHTLLWAPDIATQGKASIQIPFYTSDFTGDFQATVEGLTKTGEIIYATVSFSVK